MRKLLFIFALLSSTIAIAQTSESEIKQRMWNKSDKDFNQTEIPEKWKNESAVIICQEIKSDYDKFGLSGMGTTKLNLKEYYHKRIKLLDKAAIEAYSEFSFADELSSNRGYYTKNSTLFYGFKVIKPDGSEEVIDMQDAVDVEGDGSSNVKKIAIPNLEINDIVDYYFYSEEAFVTSKSYRFAPNISNLNASYSIMKQRYEFVVEKNFYINFKSLNGAPELKLEEDEENKKLIYTLVDEDRPKLERELWTYRYREYPVIKFQVIYARKNVKDDLLAFFGESGVAKTNVSDQEVLALVQDHMNDVGVTVKTKEKQVLAHLKKKGYNKKSVAERKLRYTYYYLRHVMYNKSIENEYISRGRAGVSDIRFAQIMTRLLKRWEIPHELLVVANRDYTNLDDLIFFGETSLVVKVNLKKPVYLTNFTMHAHYNELPRYLENSEAYVIDIESSRPTIKRINTPSSDYSKNQLSTVANVKFMDGEMNTLVFNRKQEMKGLSRKNFQGKVIRFLDFIVKDGVTYDMISIFSPYYSWGYGADQDKMNEIIEKRKKLDKEAQEEAVKDAIESDFDVEVDSLYSYDLVNMGRAEKATTLIIEEEFTIENFIKKAGRNYILEAGKLIGGQIELDEEDRERKKDVFMPYARSFKYEINVTLPKGYTVQGLDKLNTTVENETGGFTSTAVVEDGVLKMTSFKYYKSNFEKLENWKKMQEFLDAAHNFTQQKVLLKKSS